MWKLQLWLWLYGFTSLLFPPHAAWQTDFTGWVRVGLQEWECRPIDTGADTETSTSTSVPTATHMNGRIRPRFIYLYLHVFPLRTLPASCFSSFLGIRKKKNIQEFSHEAPLPRRGITLPPSLSLPTICNSSMQQHPALVCYFCSKLKTLWYFL